ncbi:amidohydrolase family protein [Streptomyces sp. NPDC020800]|uniref:amidohydrolase family protein n=1 Tax=Streptomyces sp. NPDC020800 TaxID=3365092 RepID=UPI0037885936
MSLDLAGGGERGLELRADPHLRAHGLGEGLVPGDAAFGERVELRLEFLREAGTPGGGAAPLLCLQRGRQWALSTLPMSAPHEVAGELERAASLGHIGTMVYGRSGDLLLDDPVYDDLFAAAAQLGQPVFIHPQLPSPALRDASYRGFAPMTDLALATFGWGWHLDAATAALRLILRGTFDRQSGLQVVLGHWGEMLLFWLDRADSLSRIAGLQRPVSDYMRSNFFITASGMLNPVLLHHALSVTTVDRLLFSTDYPFHRPTREDITTFLGRFASDTDREKFSSGNAAALYGFINVEFSESAPRSARRPFRRS